MSDCNTVNVTLLTVLLFMLVMASGIFFEVDMTLCCYYITDIYVEVDITMFCYCLAGLTSM